MNTTDKKRILSMPTVKGELKIKGQSYSFGCIKEINDGVSKCVMIYKPQTFYGTDQAHVLTSKDNVELWIPGFGVDYLSQIIPYDDITILWSTYQGIPLELQQEKLAA